MKFLPNAGIYNEAQGQKTNLGISVLVCNLQNKITKFSNATSRRANFTNSCRIYNIIVRNET